MNDVFKVFNRAITNSLIDLYRCPAAKQAVVQVNVCNRTAGAVAYRLSVAAEGEADATSQYLEYDTSQAANTSSVKRGILLGPTDVIRAYAASAAITVTAFVLETPVPT